MKSRKHFFLRLSGPFLFVALWEIYTRVGNIDPIFAPRPTVIAKTFVDTLLFGDLLFHAVVSLERVLIGFILSAITAITLGLFVGWSRLLSDFFDPLIELTRPISPISLIPLAILWFGIGPESKIFVIFMATFFPILLNTIAGVRSCDRQMIRAAMALGASQLRILRTVFIPAAAPFIHTGLRISLSIAFMVIIASEMVAAQNGLGWLILDSQRVYKTETVFVGIVSISGLGFLADVGMRRLGQLLFPWMNRKEA